MNIMVLPCGCRVTRSLYGNREVVSVSLCSDHVGDEAVQSLLTQVCERVKRLADGPTKDEPSEGLLQAR